MGAGRRLDPFLVWALASVVAMVIGGIGPWIKVLGVGISGTDGSNDGWIVVGLGVVGGALVALRRSAGPASAAAVAGLAGFATALHDRQSVSDSLTAAGELRGIASVGWGLNLSWIASLSLGIASIVLALRLRGASEPRPSSEPSE